MHRAIKGLFIVQGNADSRACVRLSGASVIFGGEIQNPINNKTNLGTNANLKGFACEYMTAGTVVILGDPGPFAFSGMTGGIVYQKLTPEMEFDGNELTRRFAQGAHVCINKLDNDDLVNIKRLLDHYCQALIQTHQHDIADNVSLYIDDEFLNNYFVKLVPILDEFA